MTTHNIQFDGEIIITKQSTMLIFFLYALWWRYFPDILMQYLIYMNGNLGLGERGVGGGGGGGANIFIATFMKHIQFCILTGN